MKINVEFNSVEEMQEFAKLIGAPCKCTGEKVEIMVPDATKEEVKEEKKETKKNTSKKAEKSKEDKKVEDKPKEKETEKVEAEKVGVDTASTDPVKDTEPKEEGPKVTKEMLRDACAKVMKAGKQTEVKKIFEKYGASKLPELKESDYAAAYKDVEALQ